MYPNNHFSRNPAGPPQPRQQILSPFQNPNFPHANTPPPQQQQQPQPLNNFAFQTPSFSHAGTPPQQQQQQQQPLNNFAFRSPNFPYAATPPPQHQQQQQQPLNNFAFQNHNFPYAATPQQQQQQQPSASQNPNLNNTPFQRPQQSMHGGGGDLRERVERMVAATRREVAGKGECVSAWNVVQIVLKSLNVESWSDMGFPMQEVPSLHRLIVLEGKINAFIYCYVGTQRITSLHDLEVAICKDEGVEHFKDLEMGPLLKHPLVLHYFGVSSDITEVFKITATEIISLLSEFMECSKKKDVKAEDFLSFIAMRRSVASQDNLGVRIQSLGMHIHFIREAKKSEGTCLDILKQKSGKSNSSRKRPLLCSAKRKLDERFAIISKYVKSFPMENSDSGENCESLIDEDDEIDGDDQSQCKPSLNISSGFERVSNCPYPSATEEKKRLGHKFRNSPPRVGKHIRFDSSSSEDEDTNANTCRDKKSDTTECSYKLSLKNNKVYDRASSCPYPSVFEEMTRVGLGSDANHAGHQPVCIGVKESSKKKRKFNLQNLSTSRPSKFLKREKVSKEVHTRDNHQGTEADIELDVADFTFSDKDAMLFIGTWKDSCQKHNAAEILSRMLQFYNVSSRQRKKAKSMFSTYPFIGLLNIAVNSMKCGIWESVYDALQTITQNELTNTSVDKSAEYVSIEVGVRDKSSPATSKQIREHKNRRHYYCKCCKKDHPGVDCQRKPVECHSCGRYGHRSYECWTKGRQIDVLQRQGRKLTRASVRSLMQQQATTVSPSTPLSVDPQSSQRGSVSRGKSNRDFERRTNVMTGVTVEDIMTKVSMYFELDQDTLKKRSLVGNKLLYLRKLLGCEVWLAGQFSVNDFRSLGYGEFLDFLENHSSLLPYDIRDLFTGTLVKKYPLEVSMHQHQLLVLFSQAFSSQMQNESITNQTFSMLLKRQFPSISLSIDGFVEDFLDTFEKHKNDVASKCVLFSATLLRTSNGGHVVTANTEKNALRSTDLSPDNSLTRIYESATYKDALEVLLKSPMFSDLSLWSHWDLRYAPSLGPLVEFLLNVVNSKDLLCLLTKEGKVIRIDHSATIDSFLEAVIQASAFQTAVKLLSYVSLVGGEKNAPLSLLKCHARHAFEVLLKNCMESMEQTKSVNSFIQSNISSGDYSLRDFPVHASRFGGNHNSDQMGKAVSTVSIFFLECLAYLPSEFRGFAAEVLLSGMQPVIKDSPSTVLHHCNKLQQRLMLHDVGFSLGIVEWIEDYHVFISTDTELLVSLEDFFLKGPRSVLNPSAEHEKHRSRNLTYLDEMHVSVDLDNSEAGIDKNNNIKFAEESRDSIRDHNGCVLQSSVLIKQEDAALLVESIRRDEFGLDASLSDTESGTIKKQHARLGRALHCLAQELYSQDSHFLLELVQNADDNYYSGHVEPTLSFILQESCIVVLNNERGFTAQNIRALCDVGNSTKKGYSTGYIGQKGIGFKSVFRVTDAPEIHSNGFHVKFDISEGQIGFILPQVIPPCDVNLFSRMVCSDHDRVDKNCWNTCIVLPLKSKLCEGTAMSGIVNMFLDLHPSLLLFLHRLQCIKFRNTVNDSFTVMRKEIVGDGIIRVSYGKEKMTWMVVSRNLHADVMRRGVKSTKIALAFTLQESENGCYSQRLEQQPVFAFLPLRNYGLKFILQGDFVLPSSREEVDGDSAWNQWLLSEFPDLFVSAERSFCSLPCFRESPGAAVSVYMTFVPLVGEVHGFFSSLPRLILSKLRMSNCLLIDGSNKEWVPPCKVLRGWNQQACMLLSNGLLQEHLGLGFLDRDIILSDPLARALGIEQYGPKVLLQVLSSVCCTVETIKLMGMGWLSSLLSSLYTMSFHSSGTNILNSGVDMDVIKMLQKIPFIPLSNGTYSSVEEGPIWLQYDSSNTRPDEERGFEAFPILNAKLRTVSHALLSAAYVDGSDMEMPLVDNITKMLLCIGVQRMSLHEILKSHVLPTISNEGVTDRDNNLMAEYLSFVMMHLQSGCPSCHVERQFLIAELRNKAFIMTNYGFKRAAEVPIHFTKAYGSPIDINKLTSLRSLKWHELDVSYLMHPASKRLSGGLAKWRDFFTEIGITDFVQINKVEKRVADIPDSAFRNQIWDWDLSSSQFVAEDWESPELDNLLSILSTVGKRDDCKYLLEILDKLWDSHFSDRTTGYCLCSSEQRRPFTSSFLSGIRDVQWVASSIDNMLHYPKYLFHDCDTVQSLLGSYAPYALPKVKSEKLLADIGFRTKASLDDILEMLEMWRRSATTFKASLAQMSRLYTIIWKGMASCEQKFTERLHSGPFIFMPYLLCPRRTDLVSGTFMCSKDLYWHDATGSTDQIGKLRSQCGKMSADQPFLSKTLCSIYPALHDFFVNECGVLEKPPSRTYLHVLQQLSTMALPSQAANTVFRVLQKWTDELNCGSLDSEDIIYLKESLKKVEFSVLPTKQDKWVSLHPSFGLICWCDDEKLGKEFKHVDNIDFLYFGELGTHDNEVLKKEVSVLMQTLGIPALSEVLIREAIYFNMADCNFGTSLLNWALPYAQRYLYTLHPDIYLELKSSGFISIHHLQVLGVEKLYYRNIAKTGSCSSEKQYECSCLLQGSILYTTPEAHSHTLFLELSRLFFDGNPELHLANFLHMIKTMAESGSNEEQTEIFILNSQNISKLPDEESVWSLSCATSLKENSNLFQGSVQMKASASNSESKPPKSKNKAGTNSNWPPVDWKNAPGFDYARANGFKTKPPIIQPCGSSEKRQDESECITPGDDGHLIKIDSTWTIEDAVVANSMPLIPQESISEQLIHSHPMAGIASEVVSDHINNLVSDGPETSTSNFSRRDQLRFGTPNAAQAILTGRQGELVAFKYFSERFGNMSVNWVNKDTETGLPYDLVVEGENFREFIEVKATKSPRKDWFNISVREWQFAAEKGESYSIAHVALLGNDLARVSVFTNPLKLCLQGKLHLVVMMPREQ